MVAYDDTRVPQARAGGSALLSRSAFFAIELRGGCYSVKGNNMNLNQVTVQATNIPVSIKFYQDLGLKLIVEDTHYARFECPEGEATFSVELVEPTRLSNTVVYFEVQDLIQTVQSLAAKGIAMTKPPTHESWLWHEARLVDPADNQICLYTAGENRKNPPWRLK